MVPILILKPPHTFFTFLRHNHHKPSQPRPRLPPPPRPRPPPPRRPPPPPPPPHSLNFKLALAINRIKKLIKTQDSTSSFDIKAPSLYSIFTSEPETSHTMFINNSKQEEEEEGFVVVSKEENKSGADKSEKDSYLGFKRMEEITPDLKYLVGFLCNEGYLTRSRMFMPWEELSLSHFRSIYSRGWVRKAAQRFGGANPDMANCLSENDLKTIARFGCSSLANKTTVVAKVVRSYLRIDEVPVCRACKLRKSCKTRNLELIDRAEYLNLGDVMHILTSYALGLVHHQLTVPDEVKMSAHILLNQVVQCIKREVSKEDAQRLSIKASSKHNLRQRKIRLTMRVRIQRASKRRYWKSQAIIAEQKKRIAMRVAAFKKKQTKKKLCGLQAR